ncbi:MAG: hypothetical protein J6N93_05805 [Clostridia bacterium]|nr:hypothetical protein [Clostridia bacterium]
MKKYTIDIEETVVGNFEIYAEDAETAMEIAKRKYYEGEIVLCPGECNFRQMAIENPDNEVTEWIEF